MDGSTMVECLILSYWSFQPDSTSIRQEQPFKRKQEEMGLIDLPNPSIKHGFLSSAQETFFWIENPLWNLPKFIRIEIILSIFSDYSATRVEMNHEKKLWEKLQYLETEKTFSSSISNSFIHKSK